LKSLPWVDIDNYRIEFDEQMVTARVPDMQRFDQKQLLAAFQSRDLSPVYIEEIARASNPAAPEAEIVSSPLLKPLEGEWRTNDVAPRKFWLDVQSGMLRLHTTKLGFWTTRRTPIVSVAKDAITFKEGEKSIALTYKLDLDGLVIEIPAPSVFQGQFKLGRKIEEEVQGICQ
jgi:hypothetical protein